MVMMAGEVFGEFVAREVVVGDDAVHDAGLFEHDEVAVHGALREASPRGEDLGDRERPVGRGEHVDDLLAHRGHALLMLEPQATVSRQLSCSARRSATVDASAGECTGRVRSIFDGAGRPLRELVRAPEADLRLDEAALCISASVQPGVDVDAWCARSTSSQPQCPAPSFDAVLRSSCSCAAASAVTPTTTAIPGTRSSTR